MASSPIDVLKVLKILGEVYPNYQLSGSAVGIYVRMLSDLSADLIEQAALDHISRSAFFPTIAELRSAAFDILEATQQNQSAYDAWSQVQSAIRSVGHVGQPAWEDPLTKKVVDDLGWRHLCLSDNPIADRSHFIQAYQALAERRRTAQRRPLEVQQFIALQTGSQPELLVPLAEENPTNQ
jgi:hypothetical protein